MLSLLTWLLVGLLLAVPAAEAGPYSDSAHGDKLSGVERAVASISLPGPYARGNCAHCHEQHASVDGNQPVPQNSTASPHALFSPNFNSSRQLGPYQQSDLLCFYCHSSTSSLQSDALSMGNYDYARNFGGLTSGGPVSILDAFNQPAGGPESSYHNLYDIWETAQKFGGFSPTSSPCSACHNSHRARRNRAHVTDPNFTAISLPNDHESLWGDQAEETMARYAGLYQPPLAAGAGGFEPGGVAAAFADGSQVPDYNGLCLTCHNEPVYSSRYARNLPRIDWSSLGGDGAFAGDKHGMNVHTLELLPRPPYADHTLQPTGYLLSCLDCHEPHGSPNAFLIRRGVNGGLLSGPVSDVAASNSFGNLCRQCHQDDYLARGSRDNSLVNRWETVHHLTADRPYARYMCIRCHRAGGMGGGGHLAPIGCFYCHGHGQYVDGVTLPDGRTIPAPLGGARRTF